MLPRCTASCASVSGRTGGPWPPASRTARRRIWRRIHRSLRAGLQFEHDFTGIVFYARDLDAANPLSDPLMRPYAQRFLDSVVSPRATTVAGRVRELVEFLLPLGKCSMDQVARALDMDRRTLHRQLATEGETFSSILHSTRAASPSATSRTTATPCRTITYLLGFAAPSAFSRWFHQQFGVSPSAWRATSRTRPPDDDAAQESVRVRSRAAGLDLGGADLVESDLTGGGSLDPLLDGVEGVLARPRGCLRPAARRTQPHRRPALAVPPTVPQGDGVDREKRGLMLVPGPTSRRHASSPSRMPQRPARRP